MEHLFAINSTDSDPGCHICPCTLASFIVVDNFCIEIELKKRKVLHSPKMSRKEYCISKQPNLVVAVAFQVLVGVEQE
jgi:hypothetical protein